MTQTEIDNWDGFLGSNFLKADDVTDTDQIYVCIKVEFDADNGRPMLVLESKGATSKFSLNVTNSQFVKNTGIASPKEVVGKKIKFSKVRAFSPNAKKEVDSLRIVSIE